MPLDFRRGSLRFDPTRGQIQHEETTVRFNSTVSRSEVALNGFDISFTDNDHHVLRELIDASTRNDGNNVIVGVDFLLRDNSGNIDDRFGGRVDVLVIADVA